MLYVFHGPDDYSSAAAVASLVAQHGGDAGYLTRLDGTSASWSTLRETCFTMPLFATAQVIVVRGLLGAWSGRGEGGKGGTKPAPAEFAAFIQESPEALQLILHEGELPPTNRYLKEIGALLGDRAQVRAFPVPQGAARQRWIDQAVRQRGGSIDVGAVSLLLERCTGDLHALSLEIDKLLAYTAPQSAIGRQDVELLVAQSEEASGFDLVDALSAKQAPRVVDLLQRYLAGGQAPEQLLALVGMRIRDLLLLAAAAAEGVSDGDVQTRASWTSGRLGHLQRARRDFSAGELREAHSLLVAADLALKSRPTHERPLVALLALLAVAQRRGMAELEQALTQ